MQIKPITINALNTIMTRSAQGNAARSANSAFMPQCRVSISNEGRKLSRQNGGQPKASAQGAAVQKLVLRQNKEAAQNEKTMEGYREKLKDINKELDALNKSFNRSPDKETIEKEQELLGAMRDQKAAQEEANKQYAKEAQELAAMQSAACQEEIDGKNRELWTFLKTLEEAEKSEEEREGADKNDESGADEAETGNSAGDEIQNSAAQFNAATIKRDLGVDNKFDELSAEGHRLIKLANTITQETLSESEYISSALEKDGLTDDAKAEAEDFQAAMGTVYQDVERYRSNGLYLLQAVRDARLKRISDDPLEGFQETKNSMMMSADSAVLGEARQEPLSEASEELEDEVEKLIDERNDIDKTPEEKEQEEKAQEQKDAVEEETPEEKKEKEAEEAKEAKAEEK